MFIQQANHLELPIVTTHKTVRSHVLELLSICIPLLIAGLASALMLFLDRVVLAKYDTQSMIAATIASNACYIFQNGAISLTLMAAIFVGKYNGGQQYTLIGSAVWQMIWFSVICTAIMVVTGLWGAPFLLPHDISQEGIDYFTWMMCLSGVFPLVGALSAFFIGRKQVKLVTLAVILANVLNLVLAVALVFGVPGVIPSLGAKGAAIATGIAEGCVAIVLFVIFLNQNHREKYHTHLFHLDMRFIFRCLKLGIPNSVGHMCSTAAWAFVLVLLAQTTEDHLTVMSIGLSIWMLFTFITDSLQKGVSTISANIIGAKENNALNTVLMTGLTVQCIFAIILVVPLVILPKLFVSFFVPLHGISAEELAHLTELIELTCRCIWIAYVFDGMAWVIDGLLTAVGDTKFILLMNSVGTWLFFIGPIYIWIIYGEGSPTLTLQLMIGFCVMLFLGYYLRYQLRFRNRQTV